MHEKALEKIKNKIRGSLMNCLVQDNWPHYESFYIHVDSLSDELLKHKKEWLNRSDIYSIFYDFTLKGIKTVIVDDQQIEGKLWDILGEEKSQKLTDSLYDYFISIPRTFDVFLPIPNISKNIPSPIILSDTLSLVSFQDPDKIPGGYKRGLLGLTNKFDIEKVYLKQRMQGYAGNHLENACIKKALNDFKIIFQQGLARGLFKLTSESKKGLAFWASNEHQISKSKVIAVDESFESPEVSTTELPIDLCRLMNNIDINWNGDLIRKAIDKDELDKAIIGLSKRAVQLINCQEEEAARIKAAIKWCFDSYVIENQTLVFLQVCIGLEALLGDDEYKGSLTNMLADRCAYLVSNNIKGRTKIKEKFEELYGLRSKLVHGVITELNSEQTHYLEWGRTVLELAIGIEIKHLNLDG
jgi:hypothetical protein